MRKKYIRIKIIAAIILAAVIFSACNIHTTFESDTPILRLHIRAAGDSAADQSVKLAVRDAVLGFLENELAGVKGFDTAKRKVEKNLARITAIGDTVLSERGAGYQSSAKITNEYFPLRRYGRLTLKSGYYDALVISLGRAAGANWWCVIYPSLCYLAGEGSGGRVEYRSKIAEWIRGRQ